MAAQSIRIDEATGDVTASLAQGGTVTFNLNDIPGNGWPPGRLEKLRQKVQDFFDHRVPQSDLPLDDPERTWTAQQFTDKYGGRVFLDGQDIVTRHTLFSVSHDGTRLIARTEDVR